MNERGEPTAKANNTNVDTSNFMESSSWRIWALEAWACYQLWITVKECEIVKIKVEEGVDLDSDIKNSMFPNIVL